MNECIQYSLYSNPDTYRYIMGNFFKAGVLRVSMNNDDDNNNR